jgi:energy-coupling factor transporter ATP-binding protein EcfA2
MTQASAQECALTPLVRLVDVHKSFGATEVLRGMSMEVKQGDAVRITGPSGSGKSTLLRCINGLIPVNSEIFVGANAVHRIVTDAEMIAAQERVDRLPVIQPVPAQDSAAEHHDRIGAGLKAAGGGSRAACARAAEEGKVACGRARYLGLDMEIISVDEAARLFPLMDKRHFVGALYNPLEGHVDPIDARDADAVGDEPVWHGNTVVGWVTSGGFGHCVNRSIALAYIPAPLAEHTDGFEVEILGERRRAQRVAHALYDPSGERMRAS